MATKRLDFERSGYFYYVCDMPPEDVRLCKYFKRGHSDCAHIDGDLCMSRAAQKEARGVSNGHPDGR